GLKQVMDATMGAGVDIVIDSDADLWHVEADANQFETAVLNMVINARDAMPEGGILQIGARNVSSLPPIRKHSGVLGDFVAVSIADSGAGIDASVLDRIFDPFFTTKALNKG